MMISGARTDVITDIQPGLYQENLGTVKALGCNAELFVKIKVTDIEDDIIVAEKLSDTVIHVCKNDSFPQFQASCSNFENLSRTMLKNLHERKSRMIAEKSKRGAFNFLGAGFKFLFGTMDAQDNEDIGKKLSYLTDRSNKNAEFNTKFVILTEKTLSALNQTNSVVNHHSDLLANLERKIDDINKVHNEAFWHLHFIEILNSLKLSFIAICQETDLRISEMHQMLTDLHNRVLNTKLLSYNEIIANMRKMEIDSDLKFPFDEDLPRNEVLRKLLKFAVLKNEDLIVIIFTLPLIEKENFSISKMYAIPKIQDSVATFVGSEKDILIADLQKERFVGWRSEEVEKNCVRIQETYFCSSLNVVNVNQLSCEMQIMKKTDLIKDFCKVTVLRLEETVFIKTNSKNKYLVFAPKEEFGTIIIGSQSKPIRFTSTHVIEIKSKAVLKTKNLEILFFPVDVRHDIEIELNYNWEVDTSSIYKKIPKAKITQVVKDSKIYVNNDLSELAKDLKDYDVSETVEEQNVQLVCMWVILALCCGTMVSYLIWKIVICIKTRNVKVEEDIELNSLKRQGSHDSRGRLQAKGGKM